MASGDARIRAVAAEEGFVAARDFELVAVRHGRTAWNADGRFQGHADVPLDAVGRAQAAGVAELLRGTRFTRAIASDLSRAVETATIVLGAASPAVEADPRWRELRFGTWEGLTWSEIVAGDPALAERSAGAPRFRTPPGGESFDALCARVGAALRSIDANARAGDTILVATHAGPLHALLRVALGRNEADALGVRFSPAGVTRLACSPRGSRLIDLDRTAP